MRLRRTRLRQIRGRSAQADRAAQEPARRGRLLLLDGHSLAYRAFHALPPENFSTTTGQPTNAVYGFTAMLINVLRDEQPTHVAVAFDRAEKTFRHEQYVEYKATRKETPSDFRSQLSLIFEVLDVLGITRLSVPGYEADDIIATLATQAEPRHGRADRDRRPGPDPAGHRPRHAAVHDARHQRDGPVHARSRCEAKYGLTPAQYPDFAALRGDPSDNLPGIPGVGEKTATRWIAEFGSLAELVDRVDEVKGKAGDALREHLAGVLRNSQLTQLVRDVPLEVGPRRPAARAVGPRADPPAVRHAPVPGAAGPAVLDAAERDRDPRGRGRRACRRRRRLRRGCCVARAR